jgi:ATP-dependent protease ClpP protease subunit
MAKQNNPSNITNLSIDGEIGWWGSNARWLKNELKGKQNIILSINSGGGDVFAANEMYNVLREHPYHVTTIAGSLVASAAGYLLLAGDSRHGHKNTAWMCHRVTGFAYGNSDEIRTEADLAAGLEKIIANTIADATGKNTEDVLADMLATKWLTGGEAVKEYGLITTIVDESSTEETAVDETTNKLEAKRVMENTRQKFAENPENFQHQIENFTNFLKEQENKESETNETPSNGVITMTPEEQMAAQNEGVAAERARVNAWRKFNDIDPTYVDKGIESGQEMTTSDFAHLNRVSMDATAAKVLENNSPAPVEPEQVEIPAVTAATPENSEYNEDELKWIAKYQKKGGE